MALSPVFQQGVLEHHALWQEERESRALVCHHEQAKLLAQSAVVALFGLLNGCQVRFQLACLREGNCVQAAQGRLAAVASPVSAGGGGDFEGLDGGDVHQVRAGAQVGELALLKEADLFALAGVLLNQLDLVRLVLHQFQRLRNVQLKALQRQLFLDDLLHLGLDLLDVLRGERLFHVEVVVESFLDGWADGEFGLWVQALDRLRHHMGRGVPEGFFAVLVVEGADFQVAVLGDGGAQVGDLAVDSAAAGRFGKARTQGLGYVDDRNARFKFLDASVFESDMDHR